MLTTCNPYACTSDKDLYNTITIVSHLYLRLDLVSFPQEDVSAGVNSSMSDLPDDIANKMSLFYANPTPMLNTLSGATEKFIQEVCMYVCVA